MKRIQVLDCMSEKFAKVLTDDCPSLYPEGDHIIGLEAPLRWGSPELGLISPDYFISIAEETGLIISFDKWILLMACKQIKQWQQIDRSLRVAVNLSSVHF